VKRGAQGWDSTQLSIRIGLAGSIERNGEKIRPHRIVENARPPRPAIIGRLVDDIPGIALALVMAHDIGNVRLNDGLQGGLCPGAILDFRRMSAKFPTA